MERLRRDNAAVLSGNNIRIESEGAVHKIHAIKGLSINYVRSVGTIHELSAFTGLSINYVHSTGRPRI